MCVCECVCLLCCMQELIKVLAEGEKQERKKRKYEVKLDYVTKGTKAEVSKASRKQTTHNVQGFTPATQPVA